MAELFTQISTGAANLQFLRPEWFWALIPCTLVWLLLTRQKARRGQWSQHIDPELLEHLIDGDIKGASKTYSHWLLPILFIVCTALAGPSWNKAPAQIHKSESALVVLLDLSPSMLAQDLKPSRLVRARFKLIDLLERRPEGLTALIAYAGEAHVITPLSDDQRTISALLPALEPSVMPIGGSNTEMAVDKALQLFKDAGIPEGDILLVTDGVAKRATDALYDSLKGTGFRLSILGAATLDSAPIPERDGGFIRDSNGSMVMASINERRLKELASNLGGRYQRLAIGDNDVDRLLGKINSDSASEARSRELERQFDQWLDRGYLLVWLLLPIAAYSFRRGLVLSVVFTCAITLPSEKSYASVPEDTDQQQGQIEGGQLSSFDWRNLISKPDQRGQKAFDQGDFQKAAEEFTNSAWQAASHYKQGDFEAAAKAYSADNASEQVLSPSHHYNQGNALAKAGKLKESIAAYDKALEIDASYPDAAENKALVEELIKQQEQQEQQSNDQQDQDSDQQDQNNSDNQEQEGDSDQESDDKSDQQSDQESKQDSDSNNESDKDSNSESDSDSENQDNQQSSESDSEQSEGQNQEPEDTPDMRDGEDESEEADSEEKPESGSEGGAEEGPEENSEQDSQDQSQLPENGDNQEPQGPEPMQSAEPSEDGEAAQAAEQWLNEIPDDPTGLMRNKLKHQHQLRRQQYYQGEWEPPENGALERY